MNNFFIPPKNDSIQDDFNLKIIIIKHEKIGKNILATWGSKECLTYMSNLLADTTSDRYERQGFSFDIMDAIMQLIETHNREFPKFEPKNPSDPWIVSSKFNRLL